MNDNGDGEGNLDDDDESENDNGNDGDDEITILYEICIKLVSNSYQINILLLLVSSPFLHVW